MARAICEICNKRPAIAQVRIMQSGRERTIRVCAVDLDRLQERELLSPMERMFSGEFGDLFERDFGDFASRLGYPPRRREAVDIDQFLSSHAKGLIQDAGIAAVSGGRGEVDTEHLLYAIAESALVRELLNQFNIDAKEIRTYIEQRDSIGKVKGGKERTLSISPRLKRVIEIAFQSARGLGHGYIGPEHLLLGLIEEDDGAAGALLRAYGLTAENMREKIVRVVGRGAGEGRFEPESHTPTLDIYARDLTRLAREGRLDPVIGRANEIETVIEILSRRTKNIPVLVGEPGVGKRAIVEGLAQRIVNDQVPDTLRGARIAQFSEAAIAVETKDQSDFMERIERVAKEIAANRDRLIVSVDELRAISGADVTREDTRDISSAIQRYLVRDDLRLIAATTPNEYRRIEKDTALAQRLQPIFVVEPTPAQSIEILHGLRDRYEAYHTVKIADEAIDAAVELSNRYLTNRPLPGKAIDLIDRAAARVRIGITSVPEELHELDGEILRLQRERGAASSQKQHDEVKDDAAQLEKLRQKRAVAERSWRDERGSTTVTLRRGDIAEVAARLTGIPLAQLAEDERQRLLKLEAFLHQRVIGQDEAIEAVADAIRRSRAGLSDTKHPMATFLFLGPTGVGKTELAKALTWFVFGDDDALVRLDMSEYMEEHAAARLVGRLAELVCRRPHTVILFDEIEKAHPDVYTILLRILNDGRLPGGTSRIVDFTDAIVIATSHIGSDLIQAELGTQHPRAYAAIKDDITDLLRYSFKPEFLNGIDEIVIFQALTEVQVALITRLQLERLADNARGQGVELEYTDELLLHIAQISYQPEYGARDLKRRIQSEIETPLARELLSGRLTKGDKAVVDWDDRATAPVFRKKSRTGRTPVGTRS